ncbi:hypothetical protein KC19_9G181200, partial [Ceratodon purpureus]
VEDKNKNVERVKFWNNSRCGTITSSFEPNRGLFQTLNRNPCQNSFTKTTCNIKNRGGWRICIGDCSREICSIGVQS